MLPSEVWEAQKSAQRWLTQPSCSQSTCLLSRFKKVSPLALHTLRSLFACQTLQLG